MRVTESIKFDGRNLGDMFRLKCVSAIVKKNGQPVLHLDGRYTNGRRFVRKGEYLCRFASGMWQVFGVAAYDNLAMNENE